MENPKHAIVAAHPGWYLVGAYGGESPKGQELYEVPIIAWIVCFDGDEDFPTSPTAQAVTNEMLHQDDFALKDPWGNYTVPLEQELKDRAAVIEYFKEKQRKDDAKKKKV
jgi:hypothetical protein